MKTLTATPIGQSWNIDTEPRSVTPGSAWSPVLAQAEASGESMEPSGDFVFRLLRFVEWQPGWDGERAEHITHVTAQRAIEIARRTLDVAPEPFVAPAPSGSLLLQWDFADETSVEVYADEEDEFPEWAAVTLDGAIHEVALFGPDHLARVLTDRATAIPSSRD